MGALHGRDAIPRYMAGPVLEYAGLANQGAPRDHHGRLMRRPEGLWPRVLPDLAQRLYV